jgi:predicted DNA-binding transcriptional regulator AlpA
MHTIGITTALASGTVPASGTDILLPDHQVAEVTGRSRKTLQKDRVRGGGVPFIRFGRSVRYRLSDLQAWIGSQRSFTSTSDYSSARHTGRCSNARPSADATCGETGDTGGFHA